MGIESAIDITAGQRKTVLSLLEKHLPNTTAWVYGSRAKWTARPQSDLDMVVFATPEQSSRVFDLREAFEESNLPFRVDLFVWDDVPERFRKHIKQDYVVLAEKEELGLVGDGWKTMTLGEFAPFTYGKGLPVGKRNPLGTIPVFGSNGIVGYHDSSLTEGPTIIIGRKGTVGAVHYSPIPCWPIDTTFFITGNDSALTRFKYYALSVLGLEHMNSDSAVPGLNRSDAHARTLLLPEKSEQRAIAHILGTLDDKIELNRRMNETLEEMARALFKSWFVDFDPVRAKMEGRDTGLPPDVADLFPDRLVGSELGEIPAGWEVKELGECIELAYGKALKADDRKGGSIPVYGSNGQVGWHDKKLVAGPGIVVGRKGNPGIVTWAHSDFFPIDTTFYVVPRNTDENLPFWFFALTAQDLPSVAADSAVPGLNRNLAYMNRQLVPDKQVIDEFNHYASEIFTRRHSLEEESRTLAALRDTLLPKLISGEMRVNTRDEESEAVIGKHQ